MFVAVQGSGPNAFAALVGGPRVPPPGSAPRSARVAVVGSLGPNTSGGLGSNGLPFSSPAAAAAGLTSPAVAHSAPPAVATVSAAPAAASTPLVAPPSAAPRGGLAVAPSPDACATIGPEIRAAAANDLAVTGTLAAAAAALHCEGEVPHVMLPPSEAAQAGDAGSLAYALPRALWPPAPVAVAAAQQEALPPVAAEAPTQPAEDEAAQVGGVVGVAAVVGFVKVTPQVQTLTC